MNEFINRLIKIDPAILHFISLYAEDGNDGHLVLFHQGIQQVSGLGFRSYIIFRPQVLAWPEIIWSVTLLGINLVRWVIFDSVSFIFLWRRYASKCQKGETKLSVSSPEEVGQQFANDHGANYRGAQLQRNRRARRISVIHVFCRF